MVAKELSVKQLVAFSILMQNGKGILVKSPDYITEKFNLASMTPDEYLPQLLDQMNKSLYQRYLKEWL